MNATPWNRVSRRRLCPVCNKPDWCLFTGPEHEPTATICARVESDRRAGEAGWLHRLQDDQWQPSQRTITVTPRPTTAPIDFNRLAGQYAKAVPPEALGKLADGLDLSIRSLRRLEVGWSDRHRAWTFPMADGRGNVVGIRLRLPDGRKLSVKGGREALFIPTLLPDGGRLLIAEGPTDTGALADLGFAAVGRPSCSGGRRQLVELVRRLAFDEAVIVADGDGPGRRGAEGLAAVLVAYVTALRIITPPDGIKDARDWKRSGATADGVRRIIDAAAVLRMNIRTRRAGKLWHPC